jgi:hypothetical protein
MDTRLTTAGLTSPGNFEQVVGKQEIIGNNNQDPGGQARLDLSAP